MLKTLFPILIIGFSNLTYAIVGPSSSVSDKGPENLCRIIMSEPEGLGICSGTLIAPDIILTAAHCVDKLESGYKITVNCGYKNYDPEKLHPQKTRGGNIIYVEGVNFSENAEGIDFIAHPNHMKGLEGNDIALIRLDHSLKIQTMSLKPKISKDQVTNCWSAGYGLNKNSTVGFLQVGALDTANLKANAFVSVDANFLATRTNPKEKDPSLSEVRTIIKYSEKETMNSSIMLFGDSGGPVFCKISGSDENFQIAINRALYYARKQKPGTNTFEISYTSAFNFINLDFAQSWLQKK